MSLILLKNNVNGHNIIEHSINDIYDIARRTIDYREENLLQTTVTYVTENNIEKAKVSIIANETTYSKDLNLNYSTSLISDSVSLSNFQYLLDNFQVSTTTITIKLGNNTYTMNSYFNINGQNYYVLNLNT